MSFVHYRLSAAFAASLSLAVAACASTQSSEQPQAPAAPNTQQASTSVPGEIDTEATIWTILGFAKKESERRVRAQTGSTVSPSVGEGHPDRLRVLKPASAG